MSENGNNGNLGAGIGYATDRFGNPHSALFFTNGIAGQMTTTIQQPANDVFTIAEWFNLPTDYNQPALGYTGFMICMVETQSGHNFLLDKMLQVGVGSIITNDLVYYLHPGHPVDLRTPTSVSDGQWHHAVATLSPSGMKLYLDGNLVATNANTSSQGFAGYWRIAAGNGFVDDIRIYNRALSSNEVAQLYAIESALILNVRKAVYLDSSNLWTGSNYQVQASSDLINWTNQGSVFTATNSSWRSTNYWDVANWNQLFFRIQQQ